MWSVLKLPERSFRGHPAASEIRTIEYMYRKRNKRSKFLMTMVKITAHESQWLV